MNVSSPQSSTNYQDVFEFANDIMVIHDMDTGEILEANRKACELYGHTIDELRGMSIGELTRNHPPFNTEIGLRRIHEARDSGGTVVFEWVIQDALRRETPVEVCLKRISVNGMGRVIAVARDISERRQAHAALKERERYYRKLIERSSDGIAIVSAHGCIQFVGPSIKSLLGVSARTLNGRSVYSFIAPECVDEVRAALSDLKANASVNLSYRVRHRNGEWRTHEALCRNLLDDPAVKGILINFRDITERIAAEETARVRALELSRIARISTTGEMATALAHELNQPFFAIVNFVAGCRRRINAGNLTNDELLRVLERTQNEAERAGRIINKVREFTCNRSFHRQMIDLRALIRDIRDLIEMRAREHDVSVTYSLDDANCEIECDEVLIQQVVINLAVNSIEAMSGTAGSLRALHIAVANKKDKGVEITVADTGPGLPRLSPDQIFTSFYSTKNSGLGIGLSLCQSIVETHEGHLWFTRPQDTFGTCFHVLLPRST